LLFAFFCIDKSGGDGIRDAKLQVHRDYLRQAADRIAFAGPLLSDDGKQALGSLLVIDFPSAREAQAWIAGEPYSLAGLFESIAVRAFINRWPQRAGFAPDATSTQATRPAP
jgi:uncharacterized protein YciI